jgi:hypothetical protein
LTSFPFSQEQTPFHSTAESNAKDLGALFIRQISFAKQNHSCDSRLMVTQDNTPQGGIAASANLARHLPVVFCHILKLRPSCRSKRPDIHML